MTLGYYVDWTLGYFLDMLPLVLLALIGFALLLPLRRRRLAARRLRSGPAREAGLLVFAMYVAGLVSLTLLPSHFWTDIVHGYPGLPDAAGLLHDAKKSLHYAMLTPFGEILNSLNGGAWVRYMLIGNVLLFLPLGFFVSALWRRARWYRAVFTGLGVSCFIETAQLFVGRSTSVDDVILNTLGAWLGYLLYWLVRYLWPRMAKRLWIRPLEDLERKNNENNFTEGNGCVSRAAGAHQPGTSSAEF